MTQARIQNPALTVPGALDAFQRLGASAKHAARHHTEPQLAALVVAIAAINAFNRVNAATRQLTGDHVARIVEAAAGAAA